jgi:hypothetical protein
MAVKIFISYRRSDSGGYALHIRHFLEKEFGTRYVFMDVDSIPLGANFAARLEQAVAECNVLLALIGPNWLIDRAGKRRIDDENDFPRIEIASALKRNIPVIPILLDNQKVPRVDELTEDLKELAVCNGLDIRQASFNRDMNKLIGEIRNIRRAKSSQPYSAQVVDNRHNKAGMVWTEVTFMIIGLLFGFLLSRVSITPFAFIVSTAGVPDGRKQVFYSAIFSLIFVCVPALLYFRARLLVLPGVISYGVVTAVYIFVYLITGYLSAPVATQIKTATIVVYVLASSSLGLLLLLRLKRQWELGSA